VKPAHSAGATTLVRIPLLRANAVFAMRGAAMRDAAALLPHHLAVLPSLMNDASAATTRAAEAVLMDGTLAVDADDG
jgi:hypothetical protein